MTSLLLWALAVILVATGLAGTILPLLPGAPLVFGGLFLAAWVENFQRVSWITLTILALLTIVSLVVDFVATSLGAKRVGATSLGIIGALAGSLIGIFFGIAGILFGPFIGAIVGELMSHGQIEQASRVGIATWIGLILGTATKLALALAMVGIFAIAYFL
jgi:uncharacterized protein YqgC (DUF456 family)